VTRTDSELTALQPPIAPQRVLAVPASRAHHLLAIDPQAPCVLGDRYVFGARQDSLPISSAPLSEAYDDLHRPRAGRGRSPEPLPPPPPNNQFIPITDASMLIRIYSTTNTPGALVESLTEAEHGAIAEAHTPHEGRILRMR